MPPSLSELIAALPSQDDTEPGDRTTEISMINGRFEVCVWEHGEEMIGSITARTSRIVACLSDYSLEKAITSVLKIIEDKDRAVRLGISRLSQREDQDEPNHS